MPTYHCTVPAGLLDASKKVAIAKDITRIHSAVTGAAGFFPVGNRKSPFWRA